MGEYVTVQSNNHAPDIDEESLERLQKGGEGAYREIFRKKIAEIVYLLKTDQLRDFAQQPIIVDELAGILAADLEFNLRPARSFPFVLHEETKEFIPDKTRVYWQGDSDEVRILNAQLLIGTYTLEGDF